MIDDVGQGHGIFEDLKEHVMFGFARQGAFEIDNAMLTGDIEFLHLDAAVSAEGVVYGLLKLCIGHTLIFRRQFTTPG